MAEPVGAEQQEPEVRQPPAEEAQPQVAEAQPQVAEAQPQVAEAQPQAEEAQPQVAEAQPQAEEAQPQAEEAQPQAEEAHAQPQPLPPAPASSLNPEAPAWTPPWLAAAAAPQASAQAASAEAASDKDEKKQAQPRKPKRQQWTKLDLTPTSATPHLDNLRLAGGNHQGVRSYGAGHHAYKVANGALEVHVHRHPNGTAKHAHVKSAFLAHAAGVHSQGASDDVPLHELQNYGIPYNDKTVYGSSF